MALLTVPELDHPGLRHGFATREGGLSRGLYAALNCGLGSGDDRVTVLQNRSVFAGGLGVPATRLVSLYQAHTAEALIVDGPVPAASLRGDGLATATPGLLLAVSTADCTPVLFADPQARVIGAAHAGWRGALSGILEATVQAMVSLGAAPARIAAAIGPTIRQPNYEVGPEVVAAFQAADAAYGTFFQASTRPGHALFDLPGLVAHRLAAAGLGNVADLGLCTYAEEDRFFSFRRMTHRGEADYGRHLHGIVLR